jgi:hypothetical protein
MWLVSDFMGRVLETDVGKRVYLACEDGYAPFLQVESNEQREHRLRSYRATLLVQHLGHSLAQRTLQCECTDTHCLNAACHGVPASYLRDEDCGQPAVMHLFYVNAVGGGPTDFCEPCGDNALQSGAFATSEDVAAARREEKRTCAFGFEGGICTLRAAHEGPHQKEEGHMTNGIQLPAFAAAWAALRPQIELHAENFAINAVLVAHNETCIECHNADMRDRCPKRLALKAVMDGKGAN